MHSDPPIPDAGADILAVEVEGRTYHLTPERMWTVGRYYGADLVLDEPSVSRRHARIFRDGAQWWIADEGSANGTWTAERRIASMMVGAGGLSVRLGSAHGPELILRHGDPTEVTHVAGAFPAVPSVQPPTSALDSPQGIPPHVPPHVVPPQAVPPQAVSPQAVSPGPEGSSPAPEGLPLTPGVLRIGRSRSNDLVLTDLLVSRRHAEIVVRPDGAMTVRDLGSANGTFVGGQRLTGETAFTASTVVTIGSSRIRRVGERLVHEVDSGDIAFGAHEITVRVDGATLVNGVSFSLPPRSLMAIVGPSGAGKSTLLGALTGLRPATSGNVVYAGRDLYRHYAELRQRIGFVPQEDILHTALTLEQALGYGAELRFPADTSSEERGARVREVASELRLTDRLSVPIGKLSGGQRKRASTALELLTRPSLLFLDEPTSGLDTDLDREVMQRLRQIADDGRTVVVVTHNLTHLEVCDTVMVLAEGGYVAYVGPPSGAFAHFGASTWADVFASLKTASGEQWLQRFAGSPARTRVAESPASIPTGLPAPQTSTERIRPASPLVQFGTLVRRQIRVMTTDRTVAAILVASPVVLALIARAVPGERGLAHDPANLDARQVLLVLVVGACLMGSAAAVRELVKERAIYRRERAVGLSVDVYLASKVVVLGVITLFQGAVLTVAALAGRPPPDLSLLFPAGITEVVVVVALVAATSMVLGLVISALVRDENQAMPLLVVLNMAQLVLCGGLVPIVDRFPLEYLAGLFPARWGFAAAASSVDLRGMGPLRMAPDPRWEHRDAVFLLDLLALGLIAAVGIALTLLLLRRLDPAKRR